MADPLVPSRYGWANVDGFPTGSALGTTAVLGRPVTGLSRNPDGLLPTRSLRQTSNPSELSPWCRSAAFDGDCGAAQNRQGNRKQLVSSPATTMPIKRLDVPNTPPPDRPSRAPPLTSIPSRLAPRITPMCSVTGPGAAAPRMMSADPMAGPTEPRLSDAGLMRRRSPQRSVGHNQTPRARP